MTLRRSIAAVLTVSLTPLLCASCAETGEDAWQPPRIVRIEGAKGAYSVSPMYGTLFGKAIEKAGQGEEPFKALEATTYVLIRPGELVDLMEGGPFPYAAGDGTTLSLKAERDRVILAGRKVTLELDDEEAWTWLAEAPEADLAALRMIHVGDVAPAETEGEDEGEPSVEYRRQALARLGKANPRVGALLGDVSAVQPVLETLDPPWLSLGDAALTEEDRDLLADESHLHTLMMKAQAEGGLAFLSRLSHVQTLFLTEWEGPDDDAAPPRLPTMPSLRTLIVFGSKMRDLGPVGEQPRLRELALVSAEDLADLGRLAEMPGLRSLSLQGCVKVTDLSALSGLKRLRWLALPPKTTQAQFATVCTEHPDLEILTAVGCEKVTDLAPAAGLKRLRVLCVTTVAPLAPLARAESLELLGVHTPKEQPEVEQRKTDQALVRVLEANPDLAVVRVSPMCLGSGWILLLAPMTAAAWLLARRRFRTAGRHA